MQAVQKASVLVSSVDHFRDLWPPFFHLFFKHWPGAPLPVHLIALRHYFDHPGVETIQLETDKHLGSNLLRALDNINSDYIVYLQDDYLLTGKVDNVHMTQLLAAALQTNAAYVNLVPGKICSGDAEEPALAPLSMENQWVADLKAAIWKVDVLRDAVQHGWTPWNAESGLNRYAKSRNAEGFYTVTDKNIMPIRLTQVCTTGGGAALLPHLEQLPFLGLECMLGAATLNM